MPRRRCPDGHPLEESSRSNCDPCCDVCESTDAEAKWGCARCDFDLCDECLAKIENVSSKGLPTGGDTQEEVILAHREELEKLQALLGSNHRICAGKRRATARAHFRMGDSDAAFLEANRALAIDDNTLGPDHVVSQRSQKLIASIQHLSGSGNPSVGETMAGSSSLSDNSSVLGVSVHYLQTTFLAEARVAGNDETSCVYDIEDLQSQEMGIVRRKGALVCSPADGRMGASYVDCLVGNDNVGRANYMLSYSWAYAIGDIVDSLVSFCATNNLDPKRTYVWIDCLCINQHRVVEQKNSGGTGMLDFEQEFPKKLKAIGHMLALLVPWNSPVYLTRIWCVFELYTAHHTGCRISVVMPLRERAKLARDLVGKEGCRIVLLRASSRQSLKESAHSSYEALLREDDHDNEGGGIGRLYNALANTKVQDAQASIEADRKFILNSIESGPGCDELNQRINNLLRCWVREVIGEILNGRNDTTSSIADSIGDDTITLDHAGLSNRIGSILHQNGEYDAALELFRHAHGICRKLLGPGALMTATCHINIGAIHCGNGDYDQALTEYSHALSIRTSQLGSNSVGAASVWCHIGRVLLDQEDYAGALEQYRAANAVVVDKDHELAAHSYNGIGNALESMGDLEGALEAYRKALTIRKRSLGSNHVDTAISYSLTGRVLKALGDRDGAMQEYSECLSIRSSVLGSEHLETEDCFNAIVALTGDQDCSGDVSPCD